MVSNNVNQIKAINGKIFAISESSGTHNHFSLREVYCKTMDIIKSIAVFQHQFYLKENTKNA